MAQYQLISNPSVVIDEQQYLAQVAANPAAATLYAQVNTNPVNNDGQVPSVTPFPTAYSGNGAGGGGGFGKSPLFKLNEEVFLYSTEESEFQGNKYLRFVFRRKNGGELKPSVSSISFWVEYYSNKYNFNGTAEEFYNTYKGKWLKVTECSQQVDSFDRKKQVVFLQ